jgi:hypothetical protein
MAFPTLFPDREGDFHQPRLRKIKLGEYFTHLLRFHDGRFASHSRFPYFAFNTPQRSRALSRTKVFVRQNHEDGQFTAEDIQGACVVPAHTGRDAELLDCLRVKKAPVKSMFEIGGAVYSRTQIPLRLAWAVTTHKSQRLTLGKVCLGLSSREFATGLTFVATCVISSKTVGRHSTHGQCELQPGSKARW